MVLVLGHGVERGLQRAHQALLRAQLQRTGQGGYQRPSVEMSGLSAAGLPASLPPPALAYLPLAVLVLVLQAVVLVQRQR